ncbi:MAG: HlyC/CorC family transporter [Methylacidiphilales bacterium]|nr:HlyC/CorC family transporter [Candidatus Methylacidiphilales bacterium]
MTGADWIALLVVILCLGASFFFSGSETALTAVSRARMRALEQKGDRRAATVNRLLAARERLIGGILIGNNIVNTAAASLTTGVMLALVGEVGIVYATVLVSIVVIVFSEVLPKTVAINFPERVALLVSRPVAAVVALFGPLTLVIEALVRAILKLVGLRLGGPRDVLSAHEELRGAVDLMHHEGAVVKEDRDMLGGLLALKDLEVAEVMIHRTKMVAVDIETPPADILRQMLASPHTRVPVYRQQPENIVGVLHSKNLLRAMVHAGADADQIDVAKLLLPPWYVPGTTSLEDQLRAFRRRRMHLAFVVDEYGEVMGIVTLEDILEEIVGDISDEHDLPASGIRPRADGSVTVEGAVPVRDLNRRMAWQLPESAATTIAGLVIHESGIIPEPGQTFTFHGFRFRVLRKSRNRITLLRAAPLPAGPKRPAEPR